MKQAVRVFLTSLIVEPGGESREVRHAYDGTWYRQHDGDYLVYLDEGIHTTVRWNPEEVRLYRRGDQLEAYQVFRSGEVHEFELAIGGSRLPMTARTRHVTAATDAQGGELVLAYSLNSGDTEMGDFTLTIRMAVR